MKKNIALLRGINTGGKRKILMADLRLLFDKMGFSNIKTYIQSGNVIFDSNNELSSAEIETIIAQEFHYKFGGLGENIARLLVQLLKWSMF